MDLPPTSDVNKSALPEDVPKMREGMTSSMGRLLRLPLPMKRRVLAATVRTDVTHRIFVNKRNNKGA